MSLFHWLPYLLGAAFGIWSAVHNPKEAKQRQEPIEEIEPEEHFDEAELIQMDEWLVKKGRKS